MTIILKSATVKFTFILITSICLLSTVSKAQFSYTKNFVATTEVKQPNMQTVGAINNLPPETKITKVEYIDGLGRSQQTVLLNAKQLGVDIVSPTEYDNLGRVVKQYLPYAFETNGATGSFRTNWQTEQLSFYQNNTPAILPNDLPDNNPFSINVYEPSPLNRVIQTFAPGNPWAGTVGTGSEVSVKNEFIIYDPSTGDNVKSWELNYTANPVVPIISSYTYQLGDLVKTKIIDEHGKQVVEYKDKNGNTIFKKVQLTDAFTSDSHEGWLCTYYVYDNLNRLRYVLPPKTTEYLRNNSWVLTQSIIDELCFWYEYDDRGRLITKHVPGAQPVNMVYDKRDRLIFTQDGNMLVYDLPGHDQRWLLTLYDFLNRPLATAFWYTHDERAALQALVDQDIMNGNVVTTILGDDLIVNNKPTFISRMDILTVNLYDNYQNSVGNTGSATFFAGYTFPYPAGQTTVSGDYPADAAQNITVSGKLTATKAKILDPAAVHNGNEYLFTVNYFDKEYRPLQIIKETLLGAPSGYDYITHVVTNQYDFTGKLLGNQEIVNPGGENWSVVTKNELDIEGKVTKIYKRVTSLSSTSNEKLIVTNEYDRLGRLRIKTTGTGAICENKQDYTYNIRGWLRGVNMNYLNNNILPTNQRYFGYELAYNTLTSGGSLPKPQLNGNIGSMVWASAGKAGRDALGIWPPISSGAGIKRKYDYTYDNTNRLKKADFTENKGFWINSEKDFSVSGNDNGMIRYDENGNIQSMNQMGVVGTTVQAIDILQYNYFNGGNSNRLLAVNDAVNNPFSTLGDFKELSSGAGAPQDYGYDDNGNLTVDFNKHIRNAGLGFNSPAIKYNYLNLPQSIDVLDNNGNSTRGNIRFSYDALGNKYRKTVTDNTTIPNPTTTIINYVNGFMFGGGFGIGLDQIATEEGRIRYAIQPNNTLAYEYDWFVKDHLGNTRMVLTEQLTPSPTFQYKASFENVPTEKVTKEDIAKEKELFGEDVLQPTRSPLPVELQDKDPGNKKCSLLKPGSNNGKVPYKILKVNVGDKFNIGVQYYYRPEVNKNSSKSLREDIFNNLLNGILGIGNAATGGDKTGNITQQNTITSPYGSNNALQQFTQTGQEQQTPDHRPRAYLNYVMMDTAMQFIKGGALRVGEMNAKDPEWKNLVQNDIEATKKGYFLVYISNEEQPTASLNAGNVYFDNLVIVTNEGPIMEEDHYYPFGLLMQPISTSGSGRLKNNYKFQGQELNDNFDVNYYEFKYRQHDPQIGRFTQIDPLSDKYVNNSTYAFSENKVTNNIELEGLESAQPESSKYWYTSHFNEFKYNGSLSERPLDNIPSAVGNVFVGFANFGLDFWNSGVKTVQDTREGNYWSNIGKDVTGWWKNSNKTYEFFDHMVNTPAKQQWDEFKYTLDNPRTLQNGLTMMVPFTNFNKIAAIGYLNYTGKMSSFSSVEGFSFRLGQKDYVFHTNSNAAGLSKWSSPTSFSSQGNAYNRLALGYEGSTNSGAMQFSVRNFGIYVEGTASAQGATLGGATQLLKTPLSFSTSLTYTGWPLFK